MPKFGLIKGNQLDLSYKQLDGYKPVVYEGVPEEFDQTTQYAEQSEPIDKDEHIYVGIEIKDLELDDEDELF